MPKTKTVHLSLNGGSACGVAGRNAQLGPLETVTCARCLATVAGRKRVSPDFGGRTRGSWPAKWKHSPTTPVRVPQIMASALLEIARLADQWEDPSDVLSGALDYLEPEGPDHA